MPQLPATSTWVPICGLHIPSSTLPIPLTHAPVQNVAAVGIIEDDDAGIDIEETAREEDSIDSSNAESGDGLDQSFNGYDGDDSDHIQQSVHPRAFFWQPIAIDRQADITETISRRICWAPPTLADLGSDLDDDSTSSPDSVHARIIQCWWRTCLQERRRLSVTASCGPSRQAPNLRSASAVTRLQAYWRGVCVRSYIKHQGNAATKVQRAWRYHRMRSANRSQVHRRSQVLASVENACVRVQRAWRSVLARRHGALDLERSALTLLQPGKDSHEAEMARDVSPLHSGNNMLRKPWTVTRRVSSPCQEGRRTFSVCDHSLGDPPLTNIALHPKSAGLNSDLLYAMYAGQAAGLPRSAVRSKQQRRASPTAKSVARAGAHQRQQQTSGKAPQAIPGHDQPKHSGSVSDIIRELVCGGWLSCKPHFPHVSSVQSAVSDMEKVGRALQASCPHVEIRLVTRVECSAAASAAYVAVRDTLGPERLLWHGTAWECVPNIVRYGFNRAYGYAGGIRHGARLGLGTYFAEDPTYALRFCGRRSPRALLLAGVLPGRIVRGEDGIIEPPMDRHFVRYDSTVDNSASPKVFCVFRDFQAIPLFLVEIV